MTDFTIKDKCDRCGGDYCLDGVVYPSILKTGEVRIDQATLCAVCSEGFDRLLEEKHGKKKSSYKGLSVV